MMNDRFRRRSAFSLGIVLLLGAAAVLEAQEASRSVNEAVYSEAQVERGKLLYAKNCQSCHGEALGGIDVAPPLIGGVFLSNWTGQSVGDLANRIRMTMPLNNPGTLGSATATDIIAVILKANGYVAGSADLPRDLQVQQSIRIDAPKPSP